MKRLARAIILGLTAAIVTGCASSGGGGGGSGGGAADTGLFSSREPRLEPAAPPPGPITGSMEIEFSTGYHRASHFAAN